MKTRYGKTTKDILITLAFAGIITVAVTTSPFLLYNLARWFVENKKWDKKYKRGDLYKISRSLAGLSKNKIIILREQKGKFQVQITEKGRKIIRDIEFENMKIAKPARWDGKWRVVIFDIPEGVKKYARDALRQKLQRTGFLLLQKSVWIFPYPCEKEIQLICEVFEVSQYVNIITAEKIYNDDCAKKYFSL